MNNGETNNMYPDMARAVKQVLSPPPSWNS